ncbi:MAG: PBP1A family penicillin-binding protein [Thermoleophilia bacterium]|nr:PBP1A family penicillin-binding protein [Thermoleophilia bacterium]
MSYKSRQRKTRRKRFPSLRTMAALLFLAILAASPVISRGLTSAGNNLPSLDEEEEYVAANDTLIFDSSPSPNLLAVLHAGENRIIVPPEQIPEKMKQAIVAIEDDRFYQHRGIDPLGMLRAVAVNFSEGRLVEGGSTITQQYIKNAYFSSEPSFNRKFRETIYAYELEQKWSKDRIISEYLNTIYFGNGAYGLQTAAFTYFNKPASSLTIAECALLAAIPKSPLEFSPFTNPEDARDRRNLVLSKMLKQGMISREEFDMESAAPLPPQPHPVGPESATAPYFIEYVKEQLITRYGTRTTLEGGLRVFTTLDLEKQAAAERAVSLVLDQPGDPSAALVSLEPDTGYVRAMVGGRSFADQKFNVATEGHRQPGSAFKPFVLAAAMNEGISPGTMFMSEPKRFNLGGDGTVWKVSNFDYLYLGRISLERATVFSDNSVYAELIMRIGPGDVAALAHASGVNTEFSAGPAIALGGLDNGMTPLELASAYGTFANGGNRVSGSIDFNGNGPGPISIFRVEDAAGQVIERNEPRATPVLDPVVAYHVNNVLKQAAMNGASQYTKLGRPSAGKSGTTEDHADAWYSGYTPELVTAVWIGYPGQRTSMADIRGVRVTGGSWPAQIWNIYMTEALADTPPSDFHKPPGSDLVRAQVCTHSDQVVQPWCPTSESRLFFPGREPREKCTLHQPREIAMPQLTGMPLAEAWKTAKAAALEPRLSFLSDPSQAADLVLDQNPKPGEKVRQGTTVTIAVAGTPGSVRPPAD